jgi:hypothetical protein
MKLISHTLSYSIPCFNPIIYVFMGTKFRAHFAVELRNIKSSFSSAKYISKSSDSIMFYQNQQNNLSKKKQKTAKKPCI